MLPIAVRLFSGGFGTYHTPRRKTSIMAVSIMNAVSLIKFWMLNVDVRVNVHTNRPPRFSTAGTIVSHFDPARRARYRLLVFFLCASLNYETAPNGIGN